MCKAFAASTGWSESQIALFAPLVVSPHRPIPGTGLLVPAGLDAEPPRLAERWAAIASDVLGTYRTAWRRHDPEAVNALCDSRWRLPISW